MYPNRVQPLEFSGTYRHCAAEDVEAKHHLEGPHRHTELWVSEMVRPDQDNMSQPLVDNLVTNEQS